MANLPGLQDRRQFGRRQTQAHALIISQGRPAVRCVMRDVSDGGALLEVAHPKWLPRRFRLVIESSDFQVDCEIVHRTEGAVGVRFAVPTVFNVRASTSRDVPER